MAITNNINQVVNMLNQLKESTLLEWGEYGVSEVKINTPVDTGNLRNNNNYTIEGDKTIFYNNTDYAQPVELGTNRRVAKSFIKKGIVGNTAQIISIAEKNFKKLG